MTDDMPDAKVFTAESLALDPIALARYYHHGLKAGLWTSARTARAALNDARIPVSRDVFQKAIRVYALPNSILRLFDEIHLTNAAANTLLTIVKRDGLPVLLRRSEALNAEDFPSVEALLEALGKKLRQLEIVPGTEISALSLLLAKEYTAGLESGRWSTQTEASLVLKVPRQNIVRAIQISRLPVELITLFSSNDLTLRVGRRLLSLTKSAGQDLLIDRASTITADRRPLTATAAFAVLRKNEPVGSVTSLFVKPQRLDSALIVAKKYEIGKREFRWSTMASANTLLGLPRNTVGQAIRVSKLPQMVLALFGGDVSHGEGRKLLSIAKIVGPHALLRNAHSVSRILPRPSRENLFKLLAGARISRDVKQLEVAFHVSSRGHAAHIRVSGPNVALLSDDLDDLKSWCDFLLARALAKKMTR